ncbi:MAG: hypothetical protein EA351_13195 [Gemmatimonadales bacterium]|nr:MAG: hypothetical protein EA351_13195 [Gemmatimonadales bacterium]
MPEIRLDPGPGGQSISVAALRPADIIVSTTDANVSRFIRFGTGSEVSHAMLYYGGRSVVEAIQPGVVLRSLDNALADANLAVAYRRRGVPPEAANEIVQWARAQSGKPYDARGAVAHAPKPVIVALGGLSGRHLARRERVRTDTANDRFFCSQLVIRAFAEAGYPIITGEQANKNPEQLVQAWGHGLLTYVGHLLDFSD